jgi:8-oxo-dGTP pyrophosphatase MutT (NUDIX family)
MATEYVAGFQLSPSLESVLLIQKRKPLWQAGKLNGIGGHIEPGETSDHAMVREFTEETGLDYASALNWVRFAALVAEDDSWKVYWYWAIHPMTLTGFCQGPTVEQLFGARVSDVIQGKCPTGSVVPWSTQSWKEEHTVYCIPNLRWLLPMAINCAKGEDRCSLFRVQERKFEV